MSNFKPERQEYSLSLRQKAGDSANRWLARNRSLVLRQTPVWAQSLAMLVIALGGITVIGGIFFRIDEVVTVQGQLKSIGGTVEVKTPAGGRISTVLYKDGDLVSKGQLLIKFDTRQALQKKKTLSNLINLEKQELDNQLVALQNQKNTLDGRLLVLYKRLATKNLTVAEMGKLVELGGFQRLQYLEQKDQVFELETQLEELRQDILQLSLSEKEARLSTQKSIDRMEDELKNAELQLQYQNVRSPVSGIIFDPQASAEGVLAAGERILSIVPQNGLYAEVYVPNTDIGYVKKGQSSKIRVEAFPFTRYGELSGIVNQIGADALPPDKNQAFYRFPVKLNLESSYLKKKDVKIPLKPGMAITSNLKLRDKRIISLLSDLLVDQTDSVRSIRQQ